MGSGLSSHAFYQKERHHVFSFYLRLLLDYIT